MIKCMGIIISVTIFFFCSLVQAAPGTSVKKTEKSPYRPHDPIILSFATFPELQGKTIAHLRLYHFKNNRLDPIPFQIDEIGDGGSYFFRKKYMDHEEPKGPSIHNP